VLPTVDVRFAWRFAVPEELHVGRKRLYIPSPYKCSKIYLCKSKTKMIMPKKPYKFTDEKPVAATILPLLTNSPSLLRNGTPMPPHCASGNCRANAAIVNASAYGGSGSAIRNSQLKKKPGV
jgi:hypothetical protein